MHAINHRLLLGKTNKWEQLVLHRYTPYLVTNIGLFPLLFMYTQYTTIDAKPLATKQCQYHGSIVLRIQSVFIVFRNIPKLLNIFL